MTRFTPRRRWHDAVLVEKDRGNEVFKPVRVALAGGMTLDTLVKIREARKARKTENACRGAKRG